MEKSSSLFNYLIIILNLVLVIFLRISYSHRYPLNRDTYNISHLIGINWNTTFFIKLKLKKMWNSPVYAAECLTYTGLYLVFCAFIYSYVIWFAISCINVIGGSYVAVTTLRLSRSTGPCNWSIPWREGKFWENNFTSEWITRPILKGAHMWQNGVGIHIYLLSLLFNSSRDK